MDPLAIQIGALQSVRPVLALDASLTSILREGRLVAGEILQSLDGHSVLIGVGRHRVPADSQVELQPGERFLARVVEGKEGIVLKVLGGRAGEESRLLVALRSVLGEDRPIGELLGDLAARLRIAAGSRGDAQRDLIELLQRLGEHVFLPGASGADLRDLIARSGFDYEALLLAQGSGGKGEFQFQTALAALVRQLLSGLAAHLDQRGLHLAPALLASLEKRFLQAVAGLTRPVGAATEEQALAALQAELELHLGRAAEGGAGGRLRAALRVALPGLLGNLLATEADSPVLEQLLRALRAPSEDAGLARNLKARLLSALAGLPEGTERDAVARAVAGIEAEQLLNLARREFQEGWHLSLPVPDGERWATAHLFYSDPDGAGRQAGPGADDMQRLTVAVDFSQLGPLRAEIGVRRDLVALRLVVTREEIAAELRRELPALVERLCLGAQGLGAREARVSVVLGAPRDVQVEPPGTDIRWLQEHHLMDLSG
jgi:hypothetical protein